MKKLSPISRSKPKESTELSESQLKKSLSRRRLLQCSSACACAAVCLPRDSEAYGKPVNIGGPDDFEIDSISEKFIRHNFFVIRREKRLYVITATCPHEKNYLFRNVSNPRQISCTGHDAYFDLEGSPLSGPVTNGLTRYAVSLDADGNVLVDTFSKFKESKWNEKGSFIELK